MCPRPRAHWICRAAISTRRSSATDWLGRRSGGHRQGSRLGQGDGRGGPPPQEAAGGGPIARPAEWRRAHRSPAGRSARQRMERRGGGGGPPRPRPGVGGGGRGGGGGPGGRGRPPGGGPIPRRGVLAWLLFPVG